MSSPHEVPSCKKLHSPDSASNRKSGRKFDFEGGAAEGLSKRGDSDLSKQLEMHINRRFEATQSVKPDEAFAMALQKQEIAKFK